MIPCARCIGSKVLQLTLRGVKDVKMEILGIIAIRGFFTVVDFCESVA